MQHHDTMIPTVLEYTKNNSSWIPHIMEKSRILQHWSAHHFTYFPYGCLCMCTPVLPYRPVFSM